MQPSGLRHSNCTQVGILHIRSIPAVYCGRQRSFLDPRWGSAYRQELAQDGRIEPPRLCLVCRFIAGRLSITPFG